MKKWIAGLILTGLAIGLWWAGFWNASSPRHWRHYCQSAMFAVAKRLPERAETRKTKAYLVRAALRTHKVGITTEELELSSKILADSGFPQEAASLLLALVRRDMQTYDVDAARAHAARSAELDEKESTLLTLILLNRGDIEARSRWVVKLQNGFPANEVSSAYYCLGAYRSLANPVPYHCRQLNWLQRIATARHNEYRRLEDAVASYPELAGREVQKLEAAIEERVADQMRYSNDLRGLQSEAAGLGFVAFLEAGLEMLPLPKKGDTVESFLVREGACALPYVRWACRLGAVGQAVDRMNIRKAAIAERVSNLAELVRLNDSLMGYDRDCIEEWRSGRKLEGFKRDLASQHGWLWLEVEGEVYQKIPPAGVDLEEALTSLSK
jgi:hypothetical protein